jgi:hypothetical protein
MKYVQQFKGVFCDVDSDFGMPCHKIKFKIPLDRNYCTDPVRCDGGSGSKSKSIADILDNLLIFLITNNHEQDRIN